MNPILQKMQGNQNNQNDIIKSLMKNNPNAVMQDMLKNNPQFAEFVKKNKDKTPQQIAKDYGIDLSKLNGILR